MSVWDSSVAAEANKAMLFMSEDNNALVPDVISLAVIALVRFQFLKRFHGLINAKRVEVLDYFILERE